MRQVLRGLPVSYTHLDVYKRQAENGEHADVVFMDPPRTGSDKKFMSSVIKLNPCLLYTSGSFLV